jgi:class 3 adenylate cyclase
MNANLEKRVADQVAEIDRLARLKRFVSPRVGELIVAGEIDDPLKTRRREITVVFTDLRGFTAFSETAEPEEVMGVLREYHATLGRIVHVHEGTVEHFSGDGVMILFNDPVPLEEPEVAAIRMALEMRGAVEGLARGWKKRGHDLGFGVGIANGYATLGAIGFEGRRDYGAIGPVTNLSARLCAEAAAGQVLVSQRVYGKVEERVEAEHVGEMTLKGFSKPVPAYNVLALRPSP